MLSSSLFSIMISCVLLYYLRSHNKVREKSVKFLEFVAAVVVKKLNIVFDEYNKLSEEELDRLEEKFSLCTLLNTSWEFLEDTVGYKSRSGGDYEANISDINRLMRALQNLEANISKEENFSLLKPTLEYTNSVIEALKLLK